MAKARNVGEESEIEVRKNTWKLHHKEFMEKHVKENGEMRYTNLTLEQARGLTKLKKRCKDGEIVVTTTDKSGKFFVSSRENYEE